MEGKDTLEKVLEIIKPFVTNTSALENVNEQTRIMEDLGVNSARLVDIVLEFEDKFGIEIDNDSADRVQTLGDAVQVIHEKMKK
jgi:acyl carrier protein